MEVPIKEWEKYREKYMCFLKEQEYYIILSVNIFVYLLMKFVCSDFPAQNKLTNKRKLTSSWLTKEKDFTL